jgi:hypothetical protein
MAFGITCSRISSSVVVGASLTFFSSEFKEVSNMTIDNLVKQKIEGIKGKYIIENGNERCYLSSISPLPYGYLLSFTYEDGSPLGSFSVQFSNKIMVLPECEFSAKLEKFLEDYLNAKTNSKKLTKDAIGIEFQFRWDKKQK